MFLYLSAFLAFFFFKYSRCLANCSLRLALEAEAVILPGALTIADEPYTRAWVGHCFGNATLAQIGSERPVCGGGMVATLYIRPSVGVVGAVAMRPRPAGAAEPGV